MAVGTRGKSQKNGPFIGPVAERVGFEPMRPLCLAPREQLSNARGVLQEQLDEEALGLCCLAVVPMLPSTIGLALRCSASGTMEAADVPPTHGGSLAALAGPLELGSTPGRFREGILPLLPFHGVDLTFSYHPHPPWRRSPQSPAFTETC